MTPSLFERDAGRALLRQALADPAADFRAGQWESIDALVNARKRLLVVQRTGWGKSSVYFIATRILRDRGAGPTLIVSPLLALMRNQIEAGARLGLRPMTINSTNRDDWPPMIARIEKNEADAILISPERLANDEFLKGVLLPIAHRIGMIVIDEVHCISDWGHDFRPDYRRLVDVLRHMPPDMPVLGTTATANDRVVKDVCAQLGDVSIQRGSLMRDSLALQTLRMPDQAARLAWLAAHVPTLPGTGIVYTLTKRDAETVARWLDRNGVRARAYHGDVLPDLEADPEFRGSAAYAEFERAKAKASGNRWFDAEGSLSNVYRQYLEECLLTNRLKALVATTALGMGYDKPDLGFVVHYQAPGSIVAYYQQVGRAGRAIEHAVCVLLAGGEDADILEHFRRNAFPEERDVAAILRALGEAGSEIDGESGANAGTGISSADLQRSMNLTRGQIERVLKYLSVERPAPVVKEGTLWRRTPIAWRMDTERIRRLTHQRELEWAEVCTYVDSNDCLMTFLARSLDDLGPTACGRCAPCRGEPIVPETFPHEQAVAAARFLNAAEIPLECARQTVRGAFEHYAFLAHLRGPLRAETGRSLSRWGEAGWGRVVAEGRQAGRFGDDIADALAEMIRDRWQPNPAPRWVTCVPSKRRPDLVPDLARRVAARLGLPFAPVLVKARDNEPQSRQRNRHHQCSNLDAAFALEGKLPAGPLLLVDDFADSRWTLSVCAALLRHTGSGPVHPVALATMNTRD